MPNPARRAGVHLDMEWPGDPHGTAIAPGLGRVRVPGPGRVASGPVPTPPAAGGAVAAIRPRHTEPVGLGELARLLGVSVGTPADDVVVTGVTLDSRSVRPGDLYAAIPGAVTHGAQYVEQAAKAGAAAV